MWYSSIVILRIIFITHSSYLIIRTVSNNSLLASVSFLRFLDRLTVGIGSPFPLPGTPSSPSGPSTVAFQKAITLHGALTQFERVAANTVTNTERLLAAAEGVVAIFSDLREFYYSAMCMRCQTVTHTSTLLARGLEWQVIGVNIPKSRLVPAL